MPFPAGNRGGPALRAAIFWNSSSVITGFLKKLPALRPHSGTACIANVFGYEIRDYVGVIEALNHAPGIAAYELNASCPNTQHGGMVFGTDTGILDQLVTRAKAVSRRPLIVKLSPNVTSIAQMAKCAENAGADA